MTGSREEHGSARLTIRDVAARAGVSRAAVSLAFNDKPGVSARTRAHILAVAKEMGWEPNRSAKALGERGTGTVGLAICRPARQLGLEPFYMEFISGIESVLTQRSSALLLRLVRDIDEELDLQRHWWRSGQIAGSVLVDFRREDPRVPVLARLGMPAVAVGHPSLTGSFAALWTDDGTAVTECVRYLAALGHRRLARVGGSAELGHSAIRATAFTAAVRELRLDEGRQLATDFSGEQGARATRALLASADRPTAILYDNDLMAVAALSVAAEMGLRVPEDVSLLAWDDSQLCQLTRPTLSAMSHDVHHFGAEVARALYDVLGGERITARQMPTPVFTPRGSTGPPPR
ncbi:LacI family DNA-binding transcriptional regulator [Streptomyces triticirhizae]|uniref:LacI family transcriptional regulator n=1 Tax=Streptomyces triticirhizae TaxID=2483353 RepID=A0A3M2KUS4_9ACTN|nr:LacI family DNA-binding transcriptional regulator [Streptomyces triticirhizae]RMI29407.1 LacI family transcriptional regulator [Streptomyces triticirhizae]